MKKKVLITSIVIASLALMAAPISQAIITFGVPSQFDETYYGELASMYQKLKNTKGKKIVLLGNSNIAFGVNSALLQEELGYDQLDYEVCNFGLYGSIGTKAMLELSKPYIQKDDIVIFSPELYQQPLSLYFSAKEFLYSLDSDFSMLLDISDEEKKEVFGNLYSYNQEKLKYATSSKPTGTTTYTKASFDENCDMTRLNRTGNQMPDYYDSNNPITFDSSLFTQDFVDYVNNYYKDISSRGASMYYSYAPMNSAAIKTNWMNVSLFHDDLINLFDFKMLSSPYNYILDKAWFYDSNFHLNTPGMTYRTLNLASDIKNEFGLNTPLHTSYPETPALPEIEEADDPNADDSFVDDFEYTLNEDYYIITGLKEEASTKKDIVIPYHYNNKKIKSFSSNVFKGNSNIEHITIQKNIKILKDYSFDNCTNLQDIKLLQTNPDRLSVGFYFLNNTTTAKILVQKDSLDEFTSHYFWGHYAGRYETYE